MKYNFLRLATKLSILAAPIMIPQAVRLRRSIPRLPEAAGVRHGVIAGAGEPLRILLFGESTAAGVGAERIEQTIGVQWARSLAEQTGRAIEWHVVGRNGATAETALRNLVPQLVGLQVDLVGVALGANDIMQLHNSKVWECDLRAMLAGMQAALGDVPILVSGMPPIGRFPALPMPLRGVLSMRGEMLNIVTKRVVATLENVWLLNEEFPHDMTYYSSDQFHPGELGYKLWGEQLTEFCVSAELIE